MRIIAYNRLSEDVPLISGCPFQVKGMRELMDVDTGMVYTGIKLDLPDDYSLRIQATDSDVFVMSWKFTKEGELVLLVKGIGEPSMIGSLFTVWVIQESVQPVRFAEEGKITGGDDA